MISTAVPSPHSRLIELEFPGMALSNMALYVALSRAQVTLMPLRVWKYWVTCAQYLLECFTEFSSSQNLRFSLLFET